MSSKAGRGPRPGTLLKHQIPIRTFAEWDDLKAKLAEVDPVSHKRGYAAGEFCHTLDLTDIATIWTGRPSSVPEAIRPDAGGQGA